MRVGRFNVTGRLPPTTSGLSADWAGKNADESAAQISAVKIIRKDRATGII